MEQTQSFIVKYFQNILLSVSTALIIGIFQRMWGMSDDIAYLKAKDEQRAAKVDGLQLMVNKNRETLDDMNKRLTTLEVRMQNLTVHYEKN